MSVIKIINGPNLNLLGRRQPHIYGDTTMEDVLLALSEEFPQTRFDYFQSNHEGDIIDAIQQAAADRPQGIILNAGGYTHTSVAIADAVAASDIPVVELHISNIYAREEFRRRSLLSAVCAGVICGFGTSGYSLAARALLGRGDD